MLSDRKFPLVSVIISVYKAERYLEECIASVLRQDYQNIEVIFVDDGSPDLCPAICDDYSGKYENIRVIHQENQGAGAARNRKLRAGNILCLWIRTTVWTVNVRFGSWWKRRKKNRQIL